jgi:two-component system response regulator FixJ
MSDKLKVILVDDDDDVLKTLGMLFRSAGFEVTSYNNAKDFLQSPMVEEDTALVLDLRMPHVSGLEVLSELKRRNSSLPVIVHSSHADVEATVRVFEDGAYTLVQKPASKNILIDKVREAIVKHRETNKHSAASREAKQRLERLSPREKEIAQWISEGKSAREIGEKIHLSARTVETHRQNIFRKAEVKSSAEIARLLTLSELD